MELGAELIAMKSDGISVHRNLLARKVGTAVKSGSDQGLDHSKWVSCRVQVQTQWEAMEAATTAITL